MPTTPAREMKQVVHDDEFLNTINTPPMPQAAASAAGDDDHTAPVDRSGTVQGTLNGEEYNDEVTVTNSPYRTPGRPTNPPTDPEPEVLRWSVSEWASQVSEDIGFSLISRSFILFLLVSSLLFTTLLTLRLMTSTATRVFLPGDPGMYGTTSMLLSLVLISSFSSTVIDLQVRLIVSWTSMTKETVHLFYLPNRYYKPRRAIKLRNAYLGLLMITTVVGPFFAAIFKSVSEGSALAFIGSFSFYSFVTFNCILSLIWIYMWGLSIQNKYRYWRLGRNMRREWKKLNTGKDRKEVDDDYCDDISNSGGEKKKVADQSVAWQRRVLSNPIVMTEFGLDLLTVRLLSAFTFTLTIWLVVMTVIFDMTMDKLHWVFIIAAILMGALILLMSKAKPSSRSLKTSKNQYFTSHVMLLCWVLFMAVGIIASALRFGTGPTMANIILCVLTQGLLVRRHTLHLTGDFIIPHTEDIDNPTKCVPAVVPCSSVFGFFFPKNSCAPLKKSSRMVERELGLYTSDQHCLATEKHLNKTHRVLTANAVISSGLWIAFVILSAIITSYGSWFHEEHTSSVSGTPTAQAVSGTKYAACDMSFEGIPASDTAVMTLLAKHKNDDKLHADVLEIFGGQYTSTRLIFEEEQLAGVAFTDNVTTVVVADRKSEARQWAADFDIFGDTILLNGFSALSPLTPAWSHSTQKQVVSFLRKLSSSFGSARPFKIDSLQKYISSEEAEGRKVVLSGHGVAGSVLITDFSDNRPVITFGAPGTAITFDMKEASHVNIQPVGSALSFFDKDVGYLQEIDCPDASMSTCQTLTSITCEFLRNCGSPLLAKLSVC
eukprot:TRINITY_DN7634_c0_g1_i1.p1 TRINITY_DN7634_c0_g1~~TRINITY_DN7634_c0_g1_i1.p1  ORF type:complete len:828 (+),score=146.85 TRINITY_DN7634_c0_g1_i1:45-2528(+)